MLQTHEIKAITRE